MGSYKNKTAFITGGSSGIGAATAVEMARQGINVMIIARGLEGLEKTKATILENGGSVELMACDVSHYEDVEKAIKTCVSTFGSIDFLINNAGMIDPISLLAESDPEKWCQSVDVNYKGVYFTMRAALPHMLQQKKGVIVNVSSGAATNALEGWSHYCSSKAAVLSLTKCTDKEYGSQGITVVGISPGTVATDMQVSIKASGINPVSQLDPSVHLSPMVPARAITWLCSEEGKKFAGSDFILKDPDHLKIFLD